MKKNILHKMTTLKIFSFVLCFVFSLNAQIYTDKDVEICNSKFDLALNKNLFTKPLNEIISEVGKSFIGTDYGAHTIEKPGDEQLVIHLSGLDCTTLLENVITISRCVKNQKTSFEDYKQELQFIRYRDGNIAGYPTRLHYFSDWIYDNAKKGIVSDITKEIGGEKISFNVFYMSKNPDKYVHLTERPDYIPIIAQQEAEINKREYYFIPKEQVAKIESKIQNGDLIAITTNIPGLDIGHVGIAVKKENGRIHFLHAPLAGKKVEISERPLPEYLDAIKKHTGIIVLRAEGK